MRARTAQPEVVHALRLLREGFERCRLAQTASSLTFTTLISLVPLLAVGLSLFTAFPAFHHLQEHLQRQLAGALLPPRVGATVLGYLNAFAERAAGLGAAGVAGLAASAISLMFTVDRALNIIWNTPRPRPLGQRMLLYWAAMTLGPVTLGSTLAASATVLAMRNGWLHHHLPGGTGAWLTLLSWALLALALGALYRFAPNADVRWRDALGGGTLAAVGFGIAGRVFTWYVGSANFTAVYGTFAALPVFMLWIYFSWMVVLLGAIVAAQLPLLRLHAHARQRIAGAELLLALRMLRLLRDSQARAGSGCDILELAARVHRDPLQLYPLLDVLERLGWVARVMPSPAQRKPRWALVADARELRMAPLLDALVLDHHAAAAVSTALGPALDAAWNQLSLHDALAANATQHIGDEAARPE